MTPDFDSAAIKASELLIQSNIKSAPIVPLPILKSLPGVLVISFAEMSDSVGIERRTIIETFGENQDAVTSVHMDNGKLRYVVAYNQRLPFYMLQRSLARELGHIILGHDGTKPVEVRTAEAVCFSHHFLCPRPLIRAIQESGERLSIEVLGNLTGCYERCLAGMRKTPGVHVPAELNHAVKNQFASYVENFLSYQAIIAKDDDSILADFGTYMDYYEE